MFFPTSRKYRYGGERTHTRTLSTKNYIVCTFYLHKSIMSSSNMGEHTELKLHFSKRDLLSQRARIHQDLKSGQMSG